MSAGWTQVSTDADLSFVFGGTERSLSVNKDRDGWFVGAGIETQQG
jgi:opacity protein-like surface antigen